MAEFREVLYERLYVKEPGSERLRKTAAGRAKHLLATGWREVERWHADHYMTVRYERSGVNPAIGKMPHIAPAPPNRGRRDSGPGGPPRRGGRR